jgi:hypothetical protein
MRVFFLTCMLASQMSTSLFGQNKLCDSVYTRVDEAPMFKDGYDEPSFHLNNLDCELGQNFSPQRHGGTKKNTEDFGALCILCASEPLWLIVFLSKNCGGLEATTFSFYDR